jgi:putative transposase
MSNHVHLLITPPTIEAASNMMQRVNQRYAQIRNQKHRGSGKLFEQRFESEPVENERHLAYCVLYINANPYAASMPNMKNYRWSTQSLHCGQQGSDISEGFITHDHWYSALGENPIDRAASYHEIFENYLAGKLDSGFVEQEYAERTTRMEPRRAGWPPRRPDGTSAREAFAKYAKNTMQNSELDA